MACPHCLARSGLSGCDIMSRIRFSSRMLHQLDHYISASLFSFTLMFSPQRMHFRCRVATDNEGSISIKAEKPGIRGVPSVAGGGPWLPWIWWWRRLSEQLLGHDLELGTPCDYHMSETGAATTRFILFITRASLLWIHNAMRSRSRAFSFLAV